MIAVAIADDEELVCHYLRQMLSAPGSGVRVIGQAHDGAEALELIRRRQPDVLLLDVRMGRSDGLQVLEQLPQPAPRVLVLTGYPDDHSVLRALRNGAGGVITKGAAPAQIIAAIRLVAEGAQVLGPGLPTVQPAPDPAPERARIEATLTKRELDVMRRLGSGQSNADIAGELGLTEATVKGHVSSLMVKLGCSSRLQAGLLAQRTFW